MSGKIQISVFDYDDEKEVVLLLSKAGLPTGDLTPEKLMKFLVARDDDGCVMAAIGIEIYGEVGLLRSLVVHPRQRGVGFGRRLTLEMEACAREKGIKEVYLLTVTAPTYFPKLGYGVIRRETVPGCIAETEEFKNICPQSAVCMMKRL